MIRLAIACHPPRWRRLHDDEALALADDLLADGASCMWVLASFAASALLRWIEAMTALVKKRQASAAAATLLALLFASAAFFVSRYDQQLSLERTSSVDSLIVPTPSPPAPGAPRSAWEAWLHAAAVALWRTPWEKVAAVNGCRVTAIHFVPARVEAPGEPGGLHGTGMSMSGVCPLGTGVGS